MRKTFMTLLVLPLSLLGLLHAVAMADAAAGGTATTADILPKTISPLTTLIVTGLAVAAMLLRKYTSDSGFAHTKLGGALIPLGCAILTYVGDALQLHGMHVNSIVIGLGGGLAAWLAMSKPVGTGGQSGLVELRVVGGIAVAVIVGALLFGCGPVSKAYGVAYGACMSGKGLLVVDTIPGKVDTILSSSDSKDAAVSALEGIGIGAASDAVNCAVQAWLAVNQVPKNASPSPRLLIGRAAGQAYLAKHGVVSSGLLAPTYTLVLTDRDLLAPQ